MDVNPEGVAPATCDICGTDFEPGIFSRCEACGNLCCRDCLKIHYSRTESGLPSVRRILCYHCFHREGDGNSG